MNSYLSNAKMNKSHTAFATSAKAAFACSHSFNNNTNILGAIIMAPVFILVAFILVDSAAQVVRVCLIISVLLQLVLVAALILAAVIIIIKSSSLPKRLLNRLT